MKNFVQSGKVMNYVNSTGSTITSGSVVQMGDQIGIACVDIANGDTGAVMLAGVFSVAKAASQAWSQGDHVFWDHTNLVFTKTPSSDADTPAGTAFENVDNALGSTTGLVRLLQMPAAKVTAVAAIATADATDLASAEALANANKATLNSLIANLKAAGIMDN